MANLTKTADLAYFQWSQSTAKNPRLAAPISATATTITVTDPPLDEDGKIAVKAFLMGIQTDNYTETVYVPADGVQGYGNVPDTTNLGTTLTGVTRGINTAGYDITTGTAGDRIAHGQDAPVFCNVSACLQTMLSQVLLGNIDSGAANFYVGAGADVDIKIYAANGAANEPYLKYDSGNKAWYYTNDGASENPLAGAGAITAGDGLTLTAGDMDIDTSDTAIFVKTSSGAGDEDKVPILDSGGALATGYINSSTLAAYISDVTATTAEINQALDGISANVTDTNLNTLTAGNDSDADTLHKHTGALLTTGKIYYEFDNSNANETYDTTINLPVGQTAGRIVMEIHAKIYGNTAWRRYFSTLMTNGVSFVAQIIGEIVANVFYQNETSWFTFAANGADKRDITVSVTSITAGSGNDVVIRGASVVAGTPGTSSSKLSIAYQIFSA